jgi:antitoxin component YwqK of YwqJK toxin-antitoxin module
VKQTREDRLLAEAYNRVYLLEVTLSNANVEKFNKKYQTSFSSDQLKDIFDRFNKQQPRLAIKDIYGYKSLQDLQNAIAVQSNKETIKSVKSNEVNVIINNDKVLVVEPLTENASVMYGANTKWCTAGKTNNRFMSYMKNSSLVYFIDKVNNKKYAIACHEQGRGMEGFDQNDNSVHPETLLHQFKLNWDKDIKPKLVSMEKKLSTINGKYVQADVNSTIESWYVKGKLDRKDGPAQIYYFKNGAIESQAWYKNGLRDREKAPAFIEYYENGNKKQEIWYKQGEVDRKDGPAVVYYHKNGNVLKELFYKDGILVLTTTKKYDENGKLMDTFNYKELIR